MVNCRGGAVTDQTIVEMHDEILTVNLACTVLSLLIWLVSLFVIFVQNWNQHKHLFLKVIWLLISVQEVCAAVETFYLKRQVVRTDISDERIDRMVSAIDYFTLVVEPTLIAIIHWLFSVEYLSLALKLPILLGQLEYAQIEGIIRRNKCILAIANAIFYSWVAVIDGLTIYFEFDSTTLYDLDVINQVIPAATLIFAIFLLKSQITGLHKKQMAAREALMWVHTAIFTVFILATLASHITLTLAFNDEFGADSGHTT